MPRVIQTGYVCNMSAEDFWALRQDIGFDEHIAAVDKQNAEWLVNEPSVDAEGNGQIRRTTRLTYKENPIPKSVRGMVGDGDFSFKVTSTLWTHLFDEAHPMAFKTGLPVFSDRISIEGIQWCEPISATQCKLCARVNVSVKVTGLSSQIEKTIEKGSKDAYAALPGHAEAYVAKLRAQGKQPPTLRKAEPPAAAEPEEAAPTPAGREADEDPVATGEMDDGAEPTGADASDGLAAEEAAESPAEDEGLDDEAIETAAPPLSLRERTFRLRESLRRAEVLLAAEERRELQEAREALAQERRRNAELEQELTVERLKAQVLEMLIHQLQGKAPTALAPIAPPTPLAAPPPPLAPPPQPPTPAPAIAPAPATPPPPQPTPPPPAAPVAAQSAASSTLPDTPPVAPIAAPVAAPAQPDAPVPAAQPAEATEAVVAQSPAMDESTAVAMRGVLADIDGGAYAAEALCGHIVFGGACLLATEERLLLLKSGTLALQWQVPLRRIKDVQMQADKGRVLLLLLPEEGGGLFGGNLSRVIDCTSQKGGSRAALSLVFTTVQEQRALFSQRCDTRRSYR